MKVTVLASGSKGNCTYIEGESGALLIDAGLSAKETLRRLSLAGGKEELIKGILVTHEHSDHIKGLDVLARKLDVPVMGTQGTLWEFEDKRKSDRYIEMQVCRPKESFEKDDFSITPFSTYHDACDPCGFCISENGSKLGFCTDTGHITGKMAEYLCCCSAVVLESNHCPVMLENGPYPRFLKERIRDVNRGHLSNDAASEFISKNCCDIGRFVLAHLSEENNTPKKALDSAKSALGLHSSDTVIDVSLQYEVCRTFEI
ncbi:phosphoribosyl 1,2-cyclic phosphodiesterase [Methanomicrobium sp. W14]|uniref:MBL fold metallo-hydrolase n=1 Tax=Methanomicrobium sp. W14 TaxID=2817839 RepID=UPI001AE9B054|nr:MBL fold metallo-hydrolase [Methanomicrobium sp. W14]MBP2134543.1 phosphoribosyl 1,2-cyclic phosphodiesterase [Methanomicrobium sp. W14]